MLIYTHTNAYYAFLTLALCVTSLYRFDPNRLSNDDPDTILRKANLILNKLSVTNFEKLSDEFMSVGLDASDDLLNRGVDLIVLKAQMEEHFCFMYADLCRKITDMWTSEDDKNAVTTGGDDDAGEAPTTDPTSPPTTTITTEVKSIGYKFRILLLERCRIEFEVDRTQQLIDIQTNSSYSNEEKLEKEILLKKRFTGHMRFIGKIYSSI